METRIVTREEGGQTIDDDACGDGRADNEVGVVDHPEKRGRSHDLFSQQCLLHCPD